MPFPFQFFQSIPFFNRQEEEEEEEEVEEEEEAKVSGAGAPSRGAEARPEGLRRG